MMNWKRILKALRLNFKSSALLFRNQSTDFYKASRYT